MSVVDPTPFYSHEAGVLLDSLFANAPVGLAFWDRDLRYVRVNSTLAEFNGLPVEEHIGRQVSDVLPEIGTDVAGCLEQVLHTGEIVLDVEVVGETPAAPGRVRHWCASYYPVRDAAGEIAGVGAVVTEITERKAAEAAEQALQRLLGEERAVLTEVIERVPVGVCLLWGPEYHFRLVNERWSELLAQPREVIGRTVEEVFPGQAHLVHELFDPVMESGQTLTLEDFPIGVPEGVPSLDGSRYYSSTLVPIPGGDGKTAGVLSVFVETTDQVRRRRELEQELAEEHEIADTLQQSLLPDVLPDVPGLSLTARFLPAGERFDVGGDFYDVFPSGSGRWMLVMGDVCGKGPAAAALTALVRYTLRANALHDDDPAHCLAALNQAILSQQEGDGRFCTALCARLEIKDSGAALTAASAGHPPALLLSPDGSFRDLGGRGTVLGVEDSLNLAQETAPLRPGDRLVLYTDGVTEAFAPARLLSAADLAAVAARCADAPIDQVAARIEEAARGGSDEDPRDDIALLIAERVGRPAEAPAQ